MILAFFMASCSNSGTVKATTEAAPSTCAASPPRCYPARLIGRGQITKILPEPPRAAHVGQQPRRIPFHAHRPPAHPHPGVGALPQGEQLLVLHAAQKRR